METDPQLLLFSFVFCFGGGGGFQAWQFSVIQIKIIYLGFCDKFMARDFPRIFLSATDNERQTDPETCACAWSAYTYPPHNPITWLYVVSLSHSTPPLLMLSSDNSLIVYNIRILAICNVAEEEEAFHGSTHFVLPLWSEILNNATNHLITTEV